MSSPTPVRFEVRPLDALSARDLYALLALRARVFVVEQRCAYQDPDGRDLDALHVLGWDGDRLVAGARILGPGAWVFAEPAIGRVVVAPEWRGKGLARALMREAIDAVEARYGAVAMSLAAQSHLEGFYASLGFARSGEPYEEDGIPHVDMRRPAR